MIDPSLSEDRLSLMGINKKAIEIKIRYQYIGGIITKDPINVTVRKVKTLTVYHTTYSLLHNNCINVDMSLALLSSPSETNKRKLYQNFIFKPHDIIDLNQIFAEQNPIPVLLDQLQLIHSFYKDIGLVVDTMDKICTFISSDESDNIDHIYEAWIHSLIELTAVEANKYIAMIEYKYYDRLVGGDRPINFTLSQAEIIDITFCSIQKMFDKLVKKNPAITIKVIESLLIDGKMKLMFNVTEKDHGTKWIIKK